MAFNYLTAIKKNILQNFIARICVLASTFLLNILFARLLGAAGSGELFYLINNFSILSLLAGLSLESSMTYFLSKKEMDEKELTTISLIWSLIAGMLIGGVCFLNQKNFQVFPYNTSVHSFFFISGTLLATYFSGLFFARKQFFLPHLVPAIINTAFLLYGMIQGSKNASTVVAVYFLSFWINGIVLSILYFVNYSLRFSLHWPSSKTFIKLYRYSGLAFITNIVAFLAYRVDYWILKSFTPDVINNDALGNYIQVSKLIQLFLFVPTILATIIFPASASATNFNFKEFKKISLQVVLLNTVACGILVVVGNWLFVELYGNGFNQMYLCFIFSVPVILSMTVVRIISSYFAGINKIKYNLTGCLITLAIVVFLNFMLVPIIGINGSALADSTGYVVYLMVLLYFFKRNRRNNEKYSVAD